jgi:hypothetical protein
MSPMNVIYKYFLPIQDGVITVNLPKNSHICEIHNQGDNICLWVALCDVEELEERHFRIYGTGHKIENMEKMRFYTTVHMPNGLVWHIFELPLSHTQQV